MASELGTSQICAKRFEMLEARVGFEPVGSIDST